uniref:Uncharacterized protein n=1 Tax=Arundo donax TaxID=35708 RepID=A0A0A9CHL1_ARUDO
MVLVFWGCFLDLNKMVFPTTYNHTHLQAA